MVENNDYGWRMAVEAKLSVVDERTKTIDLKLDKFINTADKKYATNERVDALKEHFELINKNQDKKIHWMESKTWKLTRDIAYVTSFIAVMSKLLGLW